MNITCAGSCYKRLMDRSDQIIFRAFAGCLATIALCSVSGTEYFWVAVTALATGALSLVAWYQIGALERQQRGWETLRICNLYDIDPILVGHRKILAREWAKGCPESHLFAFEFTGILNYFDAIAIGIKQGFYKESIVRAHLGNIMAQYRDTWFADDTEDARGHGDLRDGWSCWIDLIDGWRVAGR